MKTESNFQIHVTNIIDSQTPYGFKDVFFAKTERRAKYMAVSKYLENFSDTGDYGENFLSIFNKSDCNKDTDSLIDELFTFFQESELDIFAGRHVVNTFSIKITGKAKLESC